MAQSFGATPTLRLKRSTQSGEKTMTAAWQTVYEEDSGDAYLFWSGNINLTPMAAGDTIQIQFSKKLSEDGSYVVYDTFTYTDAQPTDHKNIKIGHSANTYGTKIEMRQTAGVLRDIMCEYYDAKRLGVA